MSYMGYGHWVLVVLLAFIWLLKNWNGENVAPKPFIAAGMLILVGIGIALSDGDFKKAGFLNFMVFVDLGYASAVIAIGYSFFVFGLLSPIASVIKARNINGRNMNETSRGSDSIDPAV